MSEKILNKQQQEAVDYISGPLLIVAGAGTGKTTVISEKINYLINKKLAKPEEILALTFTEKAAGEMEERVDQQLTIGYSEMQISTFHAFGQKLLENYGLDIGLPNHFKLLTNIDAWLLVRENLDKFNLNYYRPIGNPARHIHELIKHFSKCKDELISTDDYLSYVENLKLDSDQINSDEKTRLEEVANAYHVYNQLLLDNNALDFGDLIFYSLKLLKERQNILEQLRSQFRFILVDEFQDVNFAQYELVRLLAKNSQLTVVGDDDQSIYAFRGASVSNILRFKDDYPEAKEIVLTENYRSGQKILDLAYHSIQNNNPDRLEVKLNIVKKLDAKNNQINSQILQVQEKTIEAEVDWVLQKIFELKNQGAVWSDFVILIRANAQADPFINALEKAKIPYEFLASSGLYRQPIILDVLNFLKVIDHYHESTAIYRLLLLPFWGLSEEDLQQLIHFSKKKSLSYFEVLKIIPEIGLSQKGENICQHLYSLIIEGVKKARTEKPTVVLLDFLENSGYLAYLTKKETEGDERIIKQIHHLRDFFSELAKFEENLSGAKVSDFVNHYQYLMEAGDEGSLHHPDDFFDSLKIMTIHGAKGLEFRYVFMVNLVEDRFPSRRRSEAIELPLALIKERLPEGDFHIQEERRLFYVGVTRAKEKLFLTSALNYGGVRQKKLSRFLTELSEDLFTEEIQKNNSSIFSKPLVNTSIEKENSYPTPDKFSYSQINSYQKCPYQYKLAHILHIPTKGSASFSFGQSVHNTLQKFYEKIIELNSLKQNSLFSLPTIENTSKELIKAPSLQDLLDLFETCWIADWYESEKQREAYYKKGREILKIFYQAEDGQWQIPVSLEGWFKIKVGDYFLQGRMDRIDRSTEGNLRIIDYKTGKAKEKLLADDKDQLLIYQLAVETLPEYKNLGPVEQLVFYYLEENIKLEFIGTDQELLKIKEKVLETIENIKKNDFTPTPNHFLCAHCDFRDICEFREL